MKRFLAILLALIVPLQSAWAAIVPFGMMTSEGCVQTLPMSGQRVRSGALAVGTHDCDCDALPRAGHHTLHHQGCAHLGVAMAAAASTVASPFPASGVAPNSRLASFDSVVLDVPSPPPTPGA